jgi:hypothetical protein
VALRSGMIGVDQAFLESRAATVNVGFRSGVLKSNQSGIELFVQRGALN